MLSTGHNDLVSQYLGITGSTDATMAKTMLEACDWNLESAVDIFLESGDLDNNSVNAHPTIPDLACTGSSSREQPSFGLAGGEDDVRAPIPQQVGVLVEDDYHALPARRAVRRKITDSVFDGFRDFQREADEEEARIQGRRKQTSPKAISKRKRLQDLFRPPVDIMHQGDFQSARASSTAKKKWLLVNVQKSTEFACQILNRDVWANDTVRDIIRENFVLWQVCHNSDEGERYSLFYPVGNYPHLAVIDPRTGERMSVWENFGPKPDAAQFCELAANFLASFHDSSLITEDSKSLLSNGPLEQTEDIIDKAEEEQLQAVLEASRRETNHAKSISSSDSDETGDEDQDSLETGTFQLDNQDTSSKPLKLDECSSLLRETFGKDCTAKSMPQKLTKDCAHESTPPSSAVTVMFRFPDGSRKQVIKSNKDKLEDLSSEVEQLGYSVKQYELVRSFPRENLSDCDPTTTLEASGFHMQEMIFIQER